MKLKNVLIVVNDMERRNETIIVYDVSLTAGVADDMVVSFYTCFWTCGLVSFDWKYELSVLSDL